MSDGRAKRLITFVYFVIEEYDGNDAPEPWGYYEHPADAALNVGDTIMLKTLDGRDHHQVTVTKIDGSELRTRNAK